MAVQFNKMLVDHRESHLMASQLLTPDSRRAVCAGASFTSCVPELKIHRGTQTQQNNRGGTSCTALSHAALDFQNKPSRENIAELKFRL